jgi:hypothetical protein
MKTSGKFAANTWKSGCKQADNSQQTRGKVVASGQFLANTGQFCGKGAVKFQQTHGKLATNS